MEKSTSLWVLGHKISPVPVSGDYDLVMGETPPNTPGPPPHYHTKLNEVFIVMEGEMEFVVEGELRTVRKGETVDLPPNVVHTFKNASPEPCKWINVHSPKGFISFFEEMGIRDAEANAMQKSVEDVVVKKVIERCSQFDMHLSG